MSRARLVVQPNGRISVPLALSSCHALGIAADLASPTMCGQECARLRHVYAPSLQISEADFIDASCCLAWCLSPPGSDEFPSPHKCCLSCLDLLHTLCNIRPSPLSQACNCWRHLALLRMYEASRFHGVIVSFHLVACNACVMASSLLAWRLHQHME